MRIQRNVAILCTLCVLLAAPATTAPLRPTHAPHAMVTSVHELASRVGVETLQSGGNAVDAAVATGFALAVVHPQAGNLGGGGFLLLRNATGETHFIDFREKAPAAATENMYLDPQGNVIPESSKDSSLIGYKSIGVPGSVAGLVYAERKYGKLSLERVIAPAIKLARDGFSLAFEDTQDLNKDEYLAQFPESKRIFLRDGNYYQPGELLKQPELARTLERIAKDPDDFYRGALARELAAAIHKGGGLITAADLAAYEVKEREPIRGSYRGYDIISAPPPSSGGVALVEILNILEGFDLVKFGNRSAQTIHLEAEAFRRAFYDRADFMGDPDYAKVPVAQLIDKKYAAAWRDSVDPNHASVSKDLKRPSIFNELERVAQSRLTTIREPENTTHYSVVDALRRQTRRSQRLRTHPGPGQRYRPRQATALGNDTHDPSQRRPALLGSRLARWPNDYHYRRQHRHWRRGFLARHHRGRQRAQVSSSVAPRSDSRRRPPLSRYNECSAFQRTQVEHQAFLGRRRVHHG